MRLNKKKLAALAMSAVMAASTMPFPVLAEEFTDGGKVAVADTYAATEVADVIVDVEGNVTIKYMDGTESFATTTEKVLRKKAVCGKSAAQYAYTYTVGGKTGFSSDFPVGEVPQHNWVIKETVIKYPTCMEEGSKTVETVCSNCGETKEGTKKETVNLAKTAHTWGEIKVEYSAVKNFNTDKMELVNPEEDGAYKVTTYRECTFENEKGVKCTEKDIVEEETITVKATNVEVAYQKVVVKANSNISDSSKKDIDGKKLSQIKADEDIVLEDCSKDGVYWIQSIQLVTRKNAEGETYYEETVISEVPHTIKAHHVEEVSFEAIKDVTDVSLLTPVYETKTDGTKKIVGYASKSCNKETKYYKVVKCASDKEVLSKTEEVAEAKGPHSFNSVSKTLVDDLKAAIGKDGVLTTTQYEQLAERAKAPGSGIILSLNNTCETEGTVTVTYVCDECKKVTDETVTMKVTKLGHQWGENTPENVVDATCSKEGSYDVIHTCTVCDKEEVVREGVKIPATPHSFYKENGTTIDATNAYIEFTGAVVVDTNGENLKFVENKGVYSKNAIDAFAVTAETVVKCEECGAVKTTGEDTKLEVVDCVKESGKTAGSITFKATSKKVYTVDKKTQTEKLEETYTVPYFSNLYAYLEREEEVKDPINGLNKDEYGVWRYYEDGEFQKDFVGIVEYEGGQFFVANGVLCSNASGLNLYDGEWYFLAGGQIQTQVTGLAMYNGEWFFLTNGKLDRSKSGLVEYDGAKFIVAKGELQRYSGLWQDPADGTWYFAALGQIQEQYTGTAIYDGQTFELVNGKLVR